MNAVMVYNEAGLDLTRLAVQAVFSGETAVTPRESSHWLVGELRFATLPAVPPLLLREISEAFHLRPPAGGLESSLVYPLLLRSADDSWAVRLEPSALALETREDEPYDLFVQRLPEIARIALPHLDTDFFTRTALRTIRSLPLSEALEGTRAIADQAYRFHMAMTSTKTGSSMAGNFVIHETVGPAQGLCMRDVGIYEEAVESSHLESVLKRLVHGLGEIDFGELTIHRSGNQIELPRFDPPSIDIEIAGFAPVITDVSVFGLVTGSLLHNEDAIVNDERIRLLAKKYAGASFSREDEARLDILQERILHLLPSVERRDFERLEELAAVTRRVHERHLERMDRLGLAK